MPKSSFSLNLSVTDKLDLKKLTSELNNTSVKVGFLESKSADYPDGKSVAEVAMTLEYGGLSDTTELQKKADRKKLNIRVPNPMHIPPRPFFETAWNNNKDKYENKIKNYITGLSNKSVKMTPDIFFNALGADVKKDVQDSIKNGVWIPNAPWVIRIKESSKPLIDTGQLWQSVSWEVVKNGS